MGTIHQAIESNITLGIFITIASWLLFEAMFPRNRNIGLLTVVALQSTPLLLARQTRNEPYRCLPHEFGSSAQNVLETSLFLFILLTLSASLLATLTLVEDGRLDWLKRHFYWVRPKRI